MLDVQNLRVNYGPFTALHDIGLNVNPGEIVVLLGANGAGKSTLMGILSGAVRPDAGSMILDGQPYQPRERLALSLTVPDCHVVSLKPSLEGLIVPSKVYSSMASGRPVLFLGAADGEIGRLLRGEGAFGIRVAPDDAAGIASASRKKYAGPEPLVAVTASR